MKIMPYANFYLDQIDCSKHEVHMVYWNRDLKDEDLSRYKNIHFHEFRKFMLDSIPKREKLSSFWGYRQFVLPILKSQKFDLIISLHTMPGIVLWDQLISRYRGKYIFDYRDHTLENNFVFGKMIKTFARNAKLVFVSSDAFRRYLPISEDVEVVTSHNILADSLKHRDDRKSSYKPNDKVRVSFWGLMRHTNHNKQIIDRIGNDSRFELHYYGRGLKIEDDLKEYCKQNNVTNVFFHGEYKPEERYDFINNTDIIHNSYFDENMMLAMSNKYYDGVIFRIPQLCMEGSFMAQRCLAKGVGCSLDPADPKYADRLYDYFTSIDQDSFDKNCDDDLEDIMNEYNYGKHRIEEILNSNN